MEKIGTQVDVKRMRFLQVGKHSLKEIGMRLITAAEDAEKESCDVLIQITSDLAFYYSPKDEIAQFSYVDKPIGIRGGKQ